MGILQSMWTGPYLGVSNLNTNLSYIFQKKNDLSTWIEEQPCMQMDFRQFSKNDTCQHSWKIVKNPFACMVVFQSMWKGPNHCWNFMDAGSESAT